MKEIILNGIALCVSEDGIISKDGIVCALYDNGRGYLGLDVAGKRYYAHRVVAMAYHLNPLILTDVNHKNGIKSDNRPENLEWCTRSYNIKHSYDELGRLPSRNQLGNDGALHHRSKKVNQINKDTGEIVAVHESTFLAAKAMGVHQSAITAAIFQRNRMKYCKGFKLEYSNDQHEYQKRGRNSKNHNP